MFGQNKDKIEEKNNKVESSASRYKNPEQLAGTQKKLRQEYNPNKKRPNEGKAGKLAKLVTELGATRVSNALSGIWQFGAGAWQLVKGEGPVNIDHYDEQTMKQQEVVDQLQAGGHFVGAPANEPVAEPKVERISKIDENIDKKVESAQELEKAMFSVFASLQKCSELKKRSVELKNENLDSDGKLDDITVDYHRYLWQTTKKLEKFIENLNNFMKAERGKVDSSKAKASLEEGYIISQSIIPKLQSVGIEIGSRDIKVPQFADILRKFMRLEDKSNVNEFGELGATNNSETSENTDPVTEKPQAAKQVYDSSRFRLIGKEFNDPEKSKMENNFAIFERDYKELVAYYDSENEMNFSQEDLAYLRNRISQTLSVIANQKISNPSKAQLKIKYEVFDILPKLKKYGFTYDRDNSTGEYTILTDGEINKVENNDVDIEQSSIEVSQSVESEVLESKPKINAPIDYPNTNIESFEKGTEKMEYPKIPEQVKVLQAKIDKFVTPYHYLSDGLKDRVQYFVGSQENGSFIMKSVDKEAYENTNSGSAKLRIPEFLDADFSYAANASRNIINTLNGVVKKQVEKPVGETHEQLQKFVEFTQKLKQPQKQQDADILQFEIDKYLVTGANTEMYYLLGSELNEEFSYKLVDEEAYGVAGVNKVKISLPKFENSDNSLEAQASRNIYDSLNIRKWGGRPGARFDRVAKIEENTDKKDDSSNGNAIDIDAWEKTLLR